MFREGICPRRRETIQVPDDRRKIRCMYCGEEIAVGEALGEGKKAADLADFDEYYALAAETLRELIRTCSKPMQDFKKDLYADAFGAFYSSHKRMFEAMEYVYRCQCEERKEDLLAKLTESVIEEAKDGLNACASKGRRNQRLLDYNFLVCIRSLEEQDYAECERRYRRMALELKEKYML